MNAIDTKTSRRGFLAGIAAVALAKYIPPATAAPSTVAVEPRTYGEGYAMIHNLDRHGSVVLEYDGALFARLRPGESLVFRIEDIGPNFTVRAENIPTKFSVIMVEA